MGYGRSQRDGENPVKATQRSFEIIYAPQEEAGRA